jgi:KamA family protein
MKPRYITKIDRVSGLPEKERSELEAVTKKFKFRASEYYLSLIDFDDPDDPIRRIIIPDMDELTQWGSLDASHEDLYTKVPGLQHKYTSTAVLLVNDVCGGFCRFCFRKRLFMHGNDEVVRDVSAGLAYIKEHPEITNVLVTGGDPLLLSTGKLEKIIKEVHAIDHVRIIRIGSKMPAFYPMRITEDPTLLDMIENYSSKTKRIYIMTHFNHPKEITEVAMKALNLLHQAGALTANQTPMIRGVNDDPKTLAELFQKLSFIGTPPYYVFQCRPVVGNEIYAVPLEKSWRVFKQAKKFVSGLAKRARLVMSHETGKIEIVGVSDGYTYLKYHQAADPELNSKILVFKSNPKAFWLDDYEETIDSPEYRRDQLDLDLLI